MVILLYVSSSMLLRASHHGCTCYVLFKLRYGRGRCCTHNINLSLVLLGKYKLLKLIFSNVLSQRDSSLVKHCLCFWIRFINIFRLHTDHRKD